MGGQIAIHVAASGRVPNLGGIALSAPAVAPDPEAAPPFLQFVARKLSQVLPKLQLKPLPSAFLTRDAGVIDQYLNDPLVYTGGCRARWGAEMLDAMAGCFDLARSKCGNIRLLVLHGGADKVVNPSGSKALHDAWAGPKTLEEFPDEFHEIFNEPGREAVYAKVGDWLDAATLTNA